MHGTHPLHSSFLLRCQLHYFRAKEISESPQVHGRLGDAEQLRQLFRVLRKELHNSGIVHCNLLQDWLNSLRVRLHQLAQLLDLRVVLDRGDVNVASLVDRDSNAVTTGTCTSTCTCRCWPWVLLLLLLLLREL